MPSLPSARVAPALSERRVRLRGPAGPDCPQAGPSCKLAVASPASAAPGPASPAACVVGAPVSTSPPVGPAAARAGTVPGAAASCPAPRRSPLAPPWLWCRTRWRQAGVWFRHLVPSLLAIQPLHPLVYPAATYATCGMAGSSPAFLARLVGGGRTGSSPETRTWLGGAWSAPLLASSCAWEVPAGLVPPAGAAAAVCAIWLCSLTRPLHAGVCSWQRTPACLASHPLQSAVNPAAT